MLRKKNYKEEQNFTELYSFKAYSPPGPNSPPKKYQIYYKRYRKTNQSDNIYNVIHNIHNVPGQTGNTQAATTPQYSVDRTLQLISFDGNLSFLKAYLRKIGKIRQYDTGEGSYKGHKIYTAMCVFKYQFDLVKCFRDDYLQTKIDEACLVNQKAQKEQERQEHRHQLIANHMGRQLSDKVAKLKQLQKDGFQVVTDIYGQYRMDFDANQKFVQNLPQIKKRKKKEEKQKRIREERLKQAENKSSK